MGTLDIYLKLLPRDSDDCRIDTRYWNFQIHKGYVVKQRKQHVWALMSINSFNAFKDM